MALAVISKRGSCHYAMRSKLGRGRLVHHPREPSLARTNGLRREQVGSKRPFENLPQRSGLARAGDDEGDVARGVEDRRCEGDAPEFAVRVEDRPHPTLGLAGSRLGGGEGGGGG